MSDWRSYVPAEDELPTAAMMMEAGFPGRLIYAAVDDVRREPEWAAALGWWERLDEHLRVPRGVAMWERGIVAAVSLTLLAKRLMCWRYLPVPRGVRVGNVRYVEARDLVSQEKFEAARDCGTLLVGGVGAVVYGEDKSLEPLVDIGQMRLRDGCLTLWHLQPGATTRSQNICSKLLKALDDSTLLLGGRR